MDTDSMILGAPNFRAAELGIYGVAQPTNIGLHTVLRLLARQGASTSTWISTREEPLVYINDVPFVLREEASPFLNIAAYAGISSWDLEQMEERLCDDVLRESEEHGGLIVVHDEKGIN
jgi:Inositol hexakisphosphate